MVPQHPAFASSPLQNAYAAPNALWWPWTHEVSNYTALLSYRSWAGANGDTVAATPTFITYSFHSRMTATDRDAFSGGSSRWKAFSKKDRADAKAALKKWGAASGITFLETKGDAGDIQFSWAPQKETSGFGYFPDSNSVDGEWNEVSEYSELAGNIYLNVAERGRMAKDKAFKKYVLLHEIGHALGLKHPFSEGTYNSRVLKSKYDNVKYTVMAYKYDSERSPTSLKKFDIQAIRKLYGTHKSDGKQVASWGWDKKTETLTQIGKESSDKLWGTRVSDHLHGSAGNDRLNGLAGDDLLVGGSGNDTLVGGAGRDVFRFDIDPASPTSVDAIIDFETSRDRIELASAVFVGLGPVGSLDPTKFSSELPYGPRGEVRIFLDEDALYYDPDGTGPIASLKVATIKLTTDHALNAGHFLVI